MSFEEHIRNQLKNHSSEVDTNDLWNSIKNDVRYSEKKKKRRFFFFIFFAALWGGMLTLLLFNSDHQIMIQNQSYTNNIHLSQLENQPTTNYINNIPTLHQTTHANTTPFISQTLEEQTSNVQPITTIKEGTTFSGTKAVEKTVFAPLLLSRKKQNSFSAIPIIYMQKQEPISKEKIEDKKEVLELEEETNQEEEKEEEEKIFAELKPFPYPPLGELLLEEEKEEEHISKRNKRGIRTRKIGIELGFQFGFGYSTKKLKAKTLFFENYVKERNETETHTGTIELSGNIQFQTQSGLGIRTGIHFSRMTERFHYTSPLDLLDIPIPAEASFPSFIPQKTKKALNKIEFVDLPLIFSYRVGNKNFSTNFEAGGYFNLQTYTSGYMMHYTGIYYDYGNTTTLDTYKNNIAITTHTGISFNVKINPNVYFKVGGHLKYTPKSITSKYYPLEQRYTTYGIHTGIYYDLPF